MAENINSLKANGKNCPHLGLKDDPRTILSYPSVWNLCQHCKPISVPKFEHQRAFCLTSDFTLCPVYKESAGSHFPREFRHLHHENVSLKKFPSKYVIGALIGLVLVIALIFIVLRLIPGMQTPTNNSNPTLTAVGITSPTETVQPSPDLDLTKTAEALSQPTNTPTLTPTNTIPIIPHTLLDSPIGTNPRFIIHRVKSGENLDLYAQEYNTTIEAIRAVNYYLTTPIWEDWLIVIPLDTTDTANLPAFEAYMVTEKNITVEKLAQSNLVDPALLKSYNGYPDNYQLTAGEWVLIPRAVLLSTATP